MSDFQPTNRRQFLTGRSIVQVARDAVDAMDRPDGLGAGAGSSWNAGRSGSYLAKYARCAMACEFELSFPYGRYTAEASAAVEALDRIDELETQLTIYREGGETAEINRRAYAEPVEVEAGLFELLSRADAVACDRRRV
ncbi:MAG: hypothetical protein QM811_02300 [Pirellulales bacterium]